MIHNKCIYKELGYVCQKSTLCVKCSTINNFLDFRIFVRLTINNTHNPAFMIHYCWSCFTKHMVLK